MVYGFKSMILCPKCGHYLHCVSYSNSKSVWWECPHCGYKKRDFRFGHTSSF